jgi:hypothetical protein
MRGGGERVYEWRRGEGERVKAGRPARVGRPVCIITDNLTFTVHQLVTTRGRDGVFSFLRGRGLPLMMHNFQLYISLLVLIDHWKLNKQANSKLSFQINLLIVFNAKCLIIVNMMCIVDL